MLERSYKHIHAQFSSQSNPAQSKWDSISLQLTTERLFWVLIKEWYKMYSIKDSIDIFIPINEKEYDESIEFMKNA
jgi:hypothetical protein